MSAALSIVGKSVMAVDSYQNATGLSGQALRSCWRRDIRHRGVGVLPPPPEKGKVRSGPENRSTKGLLSAELCYGRATKLGPNAVVKLKSVFARLCLEN